jgi:hypothetical protein
MAFLGRFELSVSYPFPSILFTHHRGYGETSVLTSLPGRISRFRVLFRSSKLSREGSSPLSDARRRCAAWVNVQASNNSAFCDGASEYRGSENTPQSGPRPRRPPARCLASRADPVVVRKIGCKPALGKGRKSAQKGGRGTYSSCYLHAAMPMQLEIRTAAGPPPLRFPPARRFFSCNHHDP